MIFGALRVKDEARWIQRVLASIAPVCGELIVLDDHSTDGTPELCAQAGACVYRSSFDGINETRDKNFLLSKIWERAQIGDWVLMVDGDELLMPEDVSIIRSHLDAPMLAWAPRILYAWDSEDQIRVDGVYARFSRPSMFKLASKTLQFMATYAGGNFHCSSVPGQLLRCAQPSPARLLHLGYLHREDRVRKFEWYNRVDPNNPLEDGYRHMVIGDMFPADSRFRHAGPLKLEPLMVTPTPQQSAAAN